MNISLLDGWLPPAMQLLAVLALLGAIGRRDRDWWLRRLPVAVGSAVLLTVVVALSVVYLSGVTDPLPVALWVWLGVALLALAVLVAGWRGARWWHRAVVPVAVLFAAATGANALNISTGYYPTVGDAVGELADQALPQQITLDQARTVTGSTKTGRIVTVDIPSTPSGFTHRQELVYLPPVWFRSKHRPKLPTVEMIGGEFSAPDNWVRAGNAVQTADAYAAQHHGFAPVLVFADATGGFKVDTECVNGPAGQAEDHLVKDIPKYVEATFGTSPDPHKWGIAGWSMGGTCALTLSLAHPNVFAHFVDISGDLGPNIGDKQQTITKLYGGDANAWADRDPETVLAAHHTKYRGVSGWFESGDQEAVHIAQAQKLEPMARKDGITTRISVQPGKHVWQFAATAFQEALPWLAEQLGTQGTHPANKPTKPAVPA